MALVCEQSFADPLDLTAVLQHFFDDGIHMVVEIERLVVFRKSWSKGDAKVPFYDEKSAVLTVGGLFDGLDPAAELAGFQRYFHMLQRHLLTHYSPILEIRLQGTE